MATCLFEIDFAPHHRFEPREASRRQADILWFGGRQSEGEAGHERLASRERLGCPTFATFCRFIGLYVNIKFSALVIDQQFAPERSLAKQVVEIYAGSSGDVPLEPLIHLNSFYEGLLQ